MSGRKVSVLVGSLAGMAIAWLLFVRYHDAGNVSAWCQDGQTLTKDSGSGWVVSAHETVCSGFGGSSSYSVYVRQRGEAESNNSLVFRYFEHGGEEPAQILWLSGNKIFIRARRIGQATKMLTKVGQVDILYQIDAEDYPRSP